MQPILLQAALEGSDEILRAGSLAEMQRTSYCFPDQGPMEKKVGQRLCFARCKKTEYASNAQYVILQMLAPYKVSCDSIQKPCFQSKDVSKPRWSYE